MLAEQFGQPHLLGPFIRADPFEHEILGHSAAGRKRAALGGDRLELAAQGHLGIEQGIACGPSIFADSFGKARCSMG